MLQKFLGPTSLAVRLWLFAAGYCAILMLLWTHEEHAVLFNDFFLGVFALAVAGAGIGGFRFLAYRAAVSLNLTENDRVFATLILVLIAVALVFPTAAQEKFPLWHVVLLVVADKGALLFMRDIHIQWEKRKSAKRGP